ncbi:MULTISPECIES: WGR domain-containing protein [unclassified Sphingomonas]|jgi:predicted DNA-binding WGR domain protein|uniref:WGR domain-containing protein n=1 Tax=Novosphingobium rhizosphaerae TaxID=1551649 RepID=UPI0015CC3887
METPISQSWHWQAIDNSRNVARDYHLWIQTDLFGWTTVERRWGRIGSRGQGVTLSFPDRAQAEIVARQVHERRNSAFKRIGVVYQKVG